MEIFIKDFDSKKNHKVEMTMRNHGVDIHSGKSISGMNNIVTLKFRDEISFAKLKIKSDNLKNIDFNDVEKGIKITVLIEPID